MAKFTVIVEEQFAHRFEVEAEDEDEAMEIAEELAVEGCWDKGEPAGCDRSSYIEKED